jgi:hypothetical protein
VLRPDVGEALLHLGDELVGPRRLPHDLAGGPGRLLPGDAVVDVVGRLGDGRGDPRQGVVLLAGEAGVEAKDQIGPQRGDPLDVQRPRVPDDPGWRGVAELVPGPWPDGVGTLAVP